MTTDRSFPRYLLIAVLVMVLFCGFASMPIAAAESEDSSANKLCVRFSCDIGYSQDIYLYGVSITDCDGNHFDIIPPPDLEWDALLMRWHNENDSIAVLDLTGTRLNCDERFTEVKLHLTLKRDWGFLNYCRRWDDFTLDVSNLVMKTEGKPNTVQLLADNEYEVGQADGLYICDRDHNVLKCFRPTHKDGRHGRWDV